MDALFDRLMRERDARYEREKQEADLRIKRTSKEVGKLGNRIGKIVEHMIAGDNIVKEFQYPNYEIESHSRNKKFGCTLSKCQTSSSYIRKNKENDRVCPSLGGVAEWER